MACLFIEFGFRIADNQAGLACCALEDHIDTECTGLFRAAGTVHCKVAIEPGFLREAYGLSVQLSEDDAMMFAYICDQIQYALHFLLVHKACGSIGPLVGVGQISFPVILTGIAVTHAHDHDDQQGQNKHTNTYAIETIGKTEGSKDARNEVGIWERRCCSTISGSTVLLPDLIVVNELREIPAAIEKRDDCERQG